MQCHYFSPVYQLLPVPPLSHTTPELLQALCHCKYPPDFISTKPHNSVILTYNFCFACQLSASSLPLKLSPYYLTSISPVSTRHAEALIDAFLDILEYLYIYMMSIHLYASIFTFSSSTTSLAYFSLAFQTDTKQTAWEIGAHCWADWQALGCWPRHTHGSQELSASWLLAKHHITSWLQAILWQAHASPADQLCRPLITAAMFGWK